MERGVRQTVQYYTNTNAQIGRGVRYSQYYKSFCTDGEKYQVGTVDTSVQTEKKKSQIYLGNLGVGYLTYPYITLNDQA